MFLNMDPKDHMIRTEIVAQMDMGICYNLSVPDAKIDIARFLRSSGTHRCSFSLDTDARLHKNECIVTTDSMESNPCGFSALVVLSLDVWLFAASFGGL